MKTSLIHILFLAIFFQVLALRTEAQFWMQKGGGVTIDEAYDIVVDTAGNTYTTGYFSGSADFGSGSVSSSGVTDIFVVKTDNQGNILWVRTAGGSAADRGLAIDIDSEGNCYVTGFFNDSADFDGITLISAGVQDAFIAKYTSNGTILWAKSAGGALSDASNDITVDPQHNAIITGEFRDTASFGSTTLIAQGSSVDVFISKLDSAGNFVWTQHGKGNGNNRGLNISSDGFGSVYATGQFSQNITFDQLHNNGMLNVSYFIKLDSSGQEQWFRIIGGGNSNTVQGISTDSLGNTYMTGDFTGNLTFYGPGTITLTSSYSNRVFITKYDSAGAVLWGTGMGSDNVVSSKDIDFDDLGNSYIIGNFKCELPEFTSFYGDGIFNAVGHNDIFMAAYDTGGVWQYAQQLGGVKSDFGYSISVNDSNSIHFAGSFREELNIPTTNNFFNVSSWNNNSFLNNNGFCNDTNYGWFHGIPNSGNFDAVFANCFDPARSPFDYYNRTGQSGCARPKITHCINDSCDDTVAFCLPPAFANSWQIPGVGQKFSYKWNNNFIDTLDAIQFPITFQNNLYVSNNDGCYQPDTVPFIYLPEIKPTVSDDEGINTVTTSPLPIYVCAPDSVVLTGNPLSNNYFWTSSQLSGNVFDSVLTVTTTGLYQFKYVDEIGCEHFTSVEVYIQNPLPNFKLKMTVADTITVCSGDFFNLHLWDSISNPNGNALCFNQFTYQLATSYVLSSTGSFVQVNCESQFIITPVDSGIYTLTATSVRSNACGSDTHEVTKSFFVDLKPSPPNPVFTMSVSGSPFFCPGGTVTKIASGSTNYNWSGPGLNNATGPSVTVDEAGLFQLISTQYDTNSYGCISDHQEVIDFCVAQKPQPNITASSALLCPESSITLNAGTGFAVSPCTPIQVGGLAVYYLPGPHFTWFGPSGQLPDSTGIISVDQPGSYYCVYNDSDSCALVSNTIEINQFTVPSLSLGGDPVLCDGDSITINVIADTGSIIEWLPPLSGNETQKTIGTPGQYICKITSCNLETFDTVNIIASQVEAQITLTEPLCLDDTTILIGSPGMDTYQWSPNGETTDSILVTQAGVYSLTTTDTAGCVAVSDPFTVTMDQIPTELNITGLQNFCSGDTIRLSTNVLNANYLWEPTGDTTQSIVVSRPGTFSISTIDSNGCPGEAGPFTVDTLATYAPISIAGETAFCEGDFVTITSNRISGLKDFYWSPTGDSSLSITVFESGDYVLNTIDTAGCLAVSDTVKVRVQPDNLEPPLITDTTICSGTQALLRGGDNVLGDLHWLPEGDSTQLFIGDVLETEVLEKPKVFIVWQEVQLCKSDPTTITVSIQNCKDVEIPNVFSPNGDGINDVFRTSLNADQCFFCVIYNRWGMIVQEMNSFNMGWDGTIQDTGQEAPEGVYYYVVHYCKYDGEEVNFRGTVTLMR